MITTSTAAPMSPPRHDPEDFRRELSSAQDALTQARDLLAGGVQVGMTPLQHVADVNTYLGWGVGELADAAGATGGLGFVVSANLREARRAAREVGDRWNAIVDPGVDAATVDRTAAALSPLAQRMVDRITDALAALG